MKMRWTDEETIQLIELYRSYRYLWDSKLDQYKNGFARKKAYESIVNQMGIPRLTPQDVRSKIKNLRSSYYQEIRKLGTSRSGKEAGTSRKPTWFHAFKPIMTVLQLRKGGSVTESESSGPEEPEMPEQELEQELEEGNDEDTSNPNMDAFVFSIKQEYLDEMQHHDDKDIAPVDDYLEPATKKAKTIESQVENIDTEAPTRTKSNKKLDEFQMFSNNVAAQLRRMPLDRALIIQVEVQSLIAKERIRIHKKQLSKDDDSS